MSSWSELEKVEGSDVASLDSGNVSESSNDTVVLVVNNERTTSHSVLSSSSLSFTGSDLLGGDDLGDVGVGVHSLEGGDGGLGLGDGLDGGGDDERDFGNVLDSVTTGEDEGGEGGSGDGGDGGVSLLVQVDLDMPLSPDLNRTKGSSSVLVSCVDESCCVTDLGGSEHSTTSTHVTESGLEEKTRLAFSLNNRCAAPRLTCPDRWVPPPPTRGIRATARPVPQDSAEVW